MYLIREKLFAVGDDFDIRDESGALAFHADGKALSLSNRVVIEDPAGGLLGATDGPREYKAQPGQIPTWITELSPTGSCHDECLRVQRRACSRRPTIRSQYLAFWSDSGSLSAFAFS
jgi:hypothetical protein